MGGRVVPDGLGTVVVDVHVSLMVARGSSG